MIDFILWSVLLVSSLMVGTFVLNLIFALAGFIITSVVRGIFRLFRRSEK